MRRNYISAARFVANMKRKYQINSVWVWDILADDFNIDKGIGYLMDHEQAEAAEEEIRQEVERDRRAEQKDE